MTSPLPAPWLTLFPYRSSPRAASATWNTFTTASRRPVPAPVWPHPSSTTANTPSARPSSISRTREYRYAYERTTTHPRRHLSGHSRPQGQPVGHVLYRLADAERDRQDPQESRRGSY